LRRTFSGLRARRDRAVLEHVAPEAVL
jgi:hypothetical protein